MNEPEMLKQLIAAAKERDAQCYRKWCTACNGDNQAERKRARQEYLWANAYLRQLNLADYNLGMLTP